MEIFKFKKRSNMNFNLVAKINFFLISLFCLEFCHGILEEESCPLTKIVVETTFGKVEGIGGTSRDGKPFTKFLGIPYAKAERFQPPKNPDSWTDIRDATKFGPVCPQFEPDSIQEPHIGKIVGQEDCLNLNVYTPKVPTVTSSKNEQSEAQLPVLFWLHPGLFSHDSGNYYGSEYFMDTQNTILVTLNFRLGPLGFLNVGEPGLAAGNQGLKDQIAALKWIQDNIENFGGNKSRVSIFGDDSGAAAIQYHLLSPMGQNLFQGALSFSGSCLAPWAFVKEPLKQAQKYGKSVNCPVDNMKNLVDCLKEKKMEELIPHFSVSLDFTSNLEHNWAPSIENSREAGGGQTFLTDDPRNLLRKGQILNKVPMIMGIGDLDGALPFTVKLMNNKEKLATLNKNWNTQAPLLLQYKNGVKNLEDSVSQKILKFYFPKGNSIESKDFLDFFRLFSDRHFFQPCLQSAQLFAQHGTPIYLYLIQYKGHYSFVNNFGLDQVHGAAHYDDLQFSFPLAKHGFPWIDQSYPDYVYSKGDVLLITTMAGTGKPTMSGGPFPVWDRFEPEKVPLEVYKLDGSPGHIEVPEGIRKGYEFWTELMQEFDSA